MAYSNGVERTLGQILATQERILNELERHNKALDDHIKEDKILEKRVDRIESRIAYASGIAVAIIASFSLMSDFILKQIGLR